MHPKASRNNTTSVSYRFNYAGYNCNRLLRSLTNTVVTVATERLRQVFTQSSIKNTDNFDF